MRVGLLCMTAAILFGAACASGDVKVDDGAGGTGTGGTITGVGGSGTSSSMGGMTGDGLPLGSPCMDDDECASDTCEEVFLDLPDKVCVERCMGAEDCPSDLFFCESISPGSIDGYCIPRSPAHCMPCETNSDCGYFTELCTVGPNDTVSSCHVDCSLSGEAACPDDYSCESIELGNTTRQICVPDTGPCQDALGGFCDNVQTPIPCAKDNVDGTCTGERTCDTATDRFGLCGADEPACKADCETPNPDGCVLEACGNAANTVDHCGMCNNPCPGVGAPNTSPSCNDGSCGFACSGESYDVDNNASNGCEETDPVTGNHTQGTAVYVGSFPCTDGSSNRNISATMHSDAQAHEGPAVPGFDLASGSAPDWYQIFGDGGVCQNEVVLTLNVTGTGPLDCYRLSVFTTDGTYTCDTNGLGSCNINQDGSGKYDDDSTLYLEVRKTCSNAVNGSVNYTVTGHL